MDASIENPSLEIFIKENDLTNRTLIKTVSFGTLGDSFIVFLKLQELSKRLPHLLIDHLFVTDSERVVKLTQMWNFDKSFKINDKINAKFLYLWSYVQAWEIGVFSHRKHITYTIHSQDIKFGTSFSLTNPWFDIGRQDKYDVCFQVSSGPFSPDRDWNFSPAVLERILELKKINYCFVGWDSRFVSDNPNNFNGKLSFFEIIEKISSSKLFISNIGFHTLLNCANDGKGIVYCENKQVAENYFHPEWGKNNTIITEPYLKNILDIL